MHTAESVKKLSASDDLLEAYVWVATTLNIGKRPKKKNASDK